MYELTYNHFKLAKKFINRENRVGFGLERKGLFINIIRGVSLTFLLLLLKETEQFIVDHGSRIWWSVASRVENHYHQSVPSERWCVQRQDHVVRDRQQNHSRGGKSDRIRMQRDFHSSNLPCLRLGPTFQVSIVH